MKKFHMHVYKVSELAQVDIKADNASQARFKAFDLEKAGMLKFETPDARLIALDFPMSVKTKGNKIIFNKN